MHNRIPNIPRRGIWEMREVIQIGGTLKVAIFHFLTRSYTTKTNVLSDSSGGKVKKRGKTGKLKKTAESTSPTRGREIRTID